MKRLLCFQSAVKVIKLHHSLKSFVEQSKIYHIGQKYFLGVKHIVYGTGRVEKALLTRCVRVR